MVEMNAMAVTMRHVHVTPTIVQVLIKHTQIIPESRFFTVSLD